MFEFIKKKKLKKRKDKNKITKAPSNLHKNPIELF